MKIAVCVKEVPDAGPNRRIDPGTLRMDRSGDRSLNAFDLNAIEEALRIRDAAGEGEVVLVSMGASRALESMRKGLAMGADRALLVSDEGAAGSDLVATSYVLAAALKAEAPDVVLFGQQASDADGAVLWAAVADRLRMPVVSQISELEVADGKATAKRQTEFGYDRISAPLPAVLAVADSLNEPRYPSLKGIMGAKKKPQDTKTLADSASRRTAPARPARARPSSPWASRRRAATPSRSRTTDRARRRSSTSSWKGSSYEHPRLPGAPRLRDPEGRRSACSPRRRSSTRTPRPSSSDPACASIAAGAGRYGADEGLRGRRPRARGAPAAAARGRDQQARAGPGLRHRALRRVGAGRRRGRRRLGTARRRAQLGPGRPRLGRRRAGGQALGAGRHGAGRRGLEGRAEARPGARRLLRPGREGRRGRASRTWPSASRTSRRRP